MSKSDKKAGIASISDLKKIIPPAANKKTKRNRNFEAADADLQARIDKGDWRSEFLKNYLPENEAMGKLEERRIAKLKCVCGHRGDKHFTRGWFSRILRPEDRGCRVCPKGECTGFREIK